MIAFGEIGPWQVVAALIVVAVVVGPLFCIWYFFIRRPKK